MTRRRRRKLRFAMWACVVCSVLVGAAWLASQRYHFGWRYFSYPTYLMVETGGANGVFYWGRDPTLTSGIKGVGIRAWAIDAPAWGGSWHLALRTQEWYVVVPLWFFFVASLASAFLFSRLSRRPIPGLCPRCGYDLVKIPAGVCPECGTAAAPPAP